MPNLIVSPGDHYRHLTIIREVEKKTKWYRYFECLCDCGKTTVTRIANLRNGHTVSCGCVQREFVSKKWTRHGMVGRPEYRAWVNMNQRCHNPRHPNYDRYGGRGITVCAEWRNNFNDFISHIGPRPRRGYSIDRIDNSKGYEPGNVKWATRTEQGRNTRIVLWITYNNEKRKLIELCEELGFNVGTVRGRRNRGWPDSDLFKPVI